MKDFLVALAPSVGVLVIFYIGIKALLEADRRERTAQSRIEAARHQEATAPGTGSGTVVETGASPPGTVDGSPAGRAEDGAAAGLDGPSANR